MEPILRSPASDSDSAENRQPPQKGEGKKIGIMFSDWFIMISVIGLSLGLLLQNIGLASPLQ